MKLLRPEINKNKKNKLLSVKFIVVKVCALFIEVKLGYKMMHKAVAVQIKMIKEFLMT